MDYDTLLDLATDLGYRLAMNGAETFRVEESIHLVLQAYGIASEVFSIPNSLIVSIKTAEGKSITRMRRIGFHGNDLDAVERYSNLSRRICAQKPEPSIAAQWLIETDESRVQYSIPMYLIGNFLAACGFAIFFGSTMTDSFLSGACGVVVGLISMFTSKVKANQFFSTIIAAFFMSLLAYALSAFGIVQNADTVIIGSLMLLVPGLLFTNAMRDIIYGDTNSGTNRIVHVFLIAVAIALGTAAAWQTVSILIQEPTVAVAQMTIWGQLAGAAIGCLGFSFIFNIHGHGMPLCALGGVLAWLAYLLTMHLGCSELTAYFWAAVTGAAYSEIMARIRKYPAISYLVISILPMIPGASIYYTMAYAISGDMASFSNRGMHTIGIAGVLAAGMLLVSTAFRIWAIWKRTHKH